MPLAKLGTPSMVQGTLMLGVVGNGTGAKDPLWLHELIPGQDNYTSTYTAGAMEWAVTVRGVALRWSVAPAATAFGMAASITVDAAGAGDSIVVAFGGMHHLASGRPLGWTFDGAVNPSNMRISFDAAMAKNNLAAVGGASTFNLTVDALRGGSGEYVYGATSRPFKELKVADARSLFPPAGQARTPLVAAGFAPTDLAGLVGWFDAGSLAGHVGNGSKVAGWRNKAAAPGAMGVAAQPQQQRQPVLARWQANATGSSLLPALHFDGVDDSLLGELPLPAMEKTIVAVVRPSDHADGCCSAIVNMWNQTAAGPGDLGASTNGVAVKRAGSGVYSVLDYAGENNQGLRALNNRPALLMATFGAARTALATDGCADIDLGQASLEHPSNRFALGGRLSDPAHLAGRFFQGLVAEVLVFSRALNATEQQQVGAYLAAKWSLPQAKCAAPTNDVVVGTFPADPGADAMVLSLASASGSAPPAARQQDPVAYFAAAKHRVAGLASMVSARSPDPRFDAGVATAAAAVDGLFRASPPIYVHGAMAWDVGLVGWRSQYGGTVFGWHDNVQAEGRHMFGNQEQTTGANKVCKTDTGRKMTQEAHDSRFYGKGRVKGGDGMYDMQSQMFDQQIHSWRSTGNTTHGLLLRHALELHVEWAEDCFDSDGNGLYHSYINTWPTDSVWFNGGEAPEETAYMYRAHEALRDMALGVGDAAAAAKHRAQMDKIRASFAARLWMKDRGHPPAFREEGGHQRPRPDAWLYSVFVPIEAAGLLTLEQMSQALYYTEWGLQRDPVSCSSGAGGSSAEPCGVRVWTSNWVPSIWSVREFWPGDNYALAQAYFSAGLSDEGWEVLQGNMMHDMFNYISPGLLGAPNGGMDFNDIVHPFCRAVVEGLFGYRPDYPNHRVVVTPQLPSVWKNASFATRDYSLEFAESAGVIQLTVGLAKAAAITVRVPVRAGLVKGVALGGAPAPAAQVRYEMGLHRTFVVVTTPAECSSATVAVSFGGPTSTAPVPVMNVTASQSVVLEPPPGFAFTNISDPQSALASFTMGTATVTAVVSSAAAQEFAQHQGQGQGQGTRHAIILAVVTSLADPRVTQMVQYKMRVRVAAPRVQAVSDVSAAGAGWATVNLEGAFNGNVAAIYYPDGGYVSPRPATCSARIGTDGYSAWTFTYGQGNAPPRPSLGNVPKLASHGQLTTPQGAVFDARALLGNASGPSNSSNNIAFTSLWDNYPSFVTVPVVAVQGDEIWALVAGSTNPMQTLLANAELRFEYSMRGNDGADGVQYQNETIQLVPPINYWCLSRYGGQYYDYEKDAFALPKDPPPMVQLGLDCNAMVYKFVLKQAGATLHAVTLETLSQEVVVGLLGVSVHTPTS